jgi:hypothetical protein
MAGQDWDTTASLWPDKTAGPWPNKTAKQNYLQNYLCMLSRVKKTWGGAGMKNAENAEKSVKIGGPQPKLQFLKSSNIRK